jgi:hypothetical protein
MNALQSWAYVYIGSRDHIYVCVCLGAYRVCLEEWGRGEREGERLLVNRLTIRVICES